MDLLRELAVYRPWNEQEERDCAELLRRLHSGEELYSRDNAAAHLTVSAWVVSPDTRVSAAGRCCCSTTGVPGNCSRPPEGADGGRPACEGEFDLLSARSRRCPGAAGRICPGLSD